MIKTQFKNYNFNILKPFVLIFVSSCLVSCSSNQSETYSPIDINLAAEMSMLPATVWVAEEKGFFKKYKINLNVIEFDSGRNALESMLKDSSIHISTAAQTPVVFNSFNQEPYVIFATMAYSLDDIKVLARKDHGINSAQDLKGKKIGTTARSTAHYFLEGFLNHYNYGLKDITLVDVNAAKLKGKLESGELDAITSWEPHISNAMKSIGEDNLELMISPTPFRKDFFFTARKEYAKLNTGDLQRFLKALLDAEEYINNHPQESQNIVAQRLHVNVDLIKKLWSTFTFEITLEQSILVNLENEAIWVKSLLPKYKEVPNYLDFIDVKPMAKVKPHGVNLIY